MRTLISHVSVWLLVPVSLLLLLPSPWMSLGFVGALFVFLLRWFVNRSPLPVSRANLPILILLLMTAIGFEISPALDLAVLTAAQVVASVTIFYVLLDWMRSPQDQWRVIAVLVLLSVAVAFAAPFTVQWTINKLFGLPAFYDEIWPRLGKESNPNIVAGAIVPMIPLCLVLIEKGTRFWRGLGAFSLAPLLIVSILLQSRGAMFALMVGIAVWVALHWKWTIPAMVIMLAIALILGSLVEGQPVLQLMYGQAGVSSGSSFVQRQDLWTQSIYLIRQSPWVGIGLNAYARIGSIVYPYSPEHPGLEVPHAHNLFLQIALDTGIIGLAAFVVLIGLAIRAAWQAYRASNEKHLAIGVLSALAVLLAHGFGDVVVWGTAKSSVVLWILLGIAFAFDKVRKTV